MNVVYCRKQGSFLRVSERDIFVQPLTSDSETSDSDNDNDDVPCSCACHQITENNQIACCFCSPPTNN
ncbi:hypothetical protein TNIN_157051, partial [Trichonephila inaurata madagascariensis]